MVLSCNTGSCDRCNRFTLNFTQILLSNKFIEGVPKVVFQWRLGKIISLIVIINMFHYIIIGQNIQVKNVYKKILNIYINIYIHTE